MEIIKNLLQSGTRVGVMVEDGGEIYPIPLDGLKSENAYNELKNSGYALTDAVMPEYMKNGEPISSYPSEEWTPTDDESMIFFNYLAQYPPMPMKDLYAKLEIKSAAIKFREGKYTINTREEFEKYISSIVSGTSDDDFMPVNYFVAPEARYTVEEAFKESSKLLTLAKRRHYSSARFEKFKDFICKDKGVTDITPTALIDAYMEWGLDGIQCTVIDKSVETTMDDPFTFVTPIDPNAQEIYKGYHQFVKALSQFTHRETVLVGPNRDAEDGTLFAGDIEGTLPVYPVSDTYRRNPAFVHDLDLISETHAMLSSNEYMAEPVLIPYSQPVRTWTLENGDRIIYTDSQCGIIKNSRSTSINKVSWDGFGLRNSGNFLKNLPTHLWFNQSDKFTQTTAKLHQIADKLFERVTLPCEDTTFSILMELGLTPGAAMQYVAYNGHFLNELKLCGDDTDEGSKSVPKASPDVDLYLSEEDIITFFKKPDDPSAMGHYFYDATPDAIYNAHLDIAAAENLVSKNPDRYGIITPERKVEIIHDVMEGALDIGDISEGHRVDANMTSNEIYCNLYAAHFILGMPVSAIESTCDAIEIDENLLYSCSSINVSLYSDDRAVVMPLNFRNHAARAARALKGNFMADRVLHAPTFFNVIDVAKEFHNVSVDNEQIPRRHVGMAGWCISTKTDIINADGSNYRTVERTDVLEVLQKMADDAYSFDAARKDGGFTASEMVSGRVTAMVKAKTAALDFVMYGTVRALKPNTYPEDWNTPNAQDVATLKSAAHMFYDTTLAVCDDYMDIVGKKDAEGKLTMAWNYYCVNARITPTLVIPESAYVIPETEIRAVFDSAFVSQQFEGLKGLNLLATGTYFNQSNTWDSADFQDKHLSNNAHYYVSGSEFDGDMIYYNDSSVYNALGSCTPDDIVAEVNELSKRSSRHARLTAWSLARYYNEAYAMLQVARDNGKFFSLPTHPAEMLYSSIYGTPCSFVRMSKDGDKLYYPMEKGAVLVGPSFSINSDTLYDRTIRQPKHSTKVALETKVVAPKVTSLSGFNADDLMMSSILAERDFSVGKKFIVDGDKLSCDGVSYKPEDIFSLDTLEYAVEFITGRTAVVAGVNNALYRISI